MNKLDYSQIKKDSIISEVQYYKITSDGRWRMENGESINIGQGYVESAEMFSADQVNGEVKVTATELVDLVLKNTSKAMTIHYHKALKPEDITQKIVENLYSNNGGKLLSKEEFAKRAKKLSKHLILGEERIIRGYHKGYLSDNKAFLNFTDMDIDRDMSKTYDTRNRQVNLRGLISVTVNNIKYIK
jgi:hypothetical protein